MLLPMLVKYLFSIHASAKEATPDYSVAYLVHTIFNPRLREGGDAMTPIYYWREGVFNPRLREGGDRNIL